MAFQDNPQSILSFRVGPVLCCAPSQPVESIITPPKLTHPPGSDRAQPGIFRHGSHIVKVIDLRQRFGIEPDGQTTPGNLIITRFGDESFAFWVDQILDVFDFPTEGWGALPAAIPRGIFSRTLLLNKKIHLYAEFIKLSQLNDLGYLKHYIQQLRQNENETPAKTATDDKNLQPGSNTLTDKTKATQASPSGTASQVTQANTTSGANNPTPTIKNQSTHQGESIKQKPLTDFNLRQTGTGSAAKAVTPDKNKTTNRVNGIKNTLANKPAGSRQEKYTPSHSATRSKPVTPQAAAATGAAKKDNEAGTPAILQNHPTTFSKTVTPAESHDEETSSSAIALIFILLLLTVIAAGIYLFLSPGTESLPGMVTIPVTPGETMPGTETPEENMFNTITANAKHSETPPLPAQTTRPGEKIQPLKENNIKPEATVTPAYRAEISHKENEITITIHEPGAEEKTAKAATETARITEIENTPGTTTPMTTTEEVNETLPKNPAVKPLQANELTKVIAKEKPVREIIHIVVKGDTLWAIAKKYVHDPFLYPELARLSNIKNPHRIYPGDKVRIRFIKN